MRQPGIGLGIATCGIGLSPWTVEGLGLNPSPVVFVALTALMACMIVGGFLLEVRSHRSRAYEPSQSADSTFTSLRDVEGYHSEGNITTADHFLHAQDSSDLSMRDNLHLPRGGDHDR